MDLCGDEFLLPNTEASQAVLTTNSGRSHPPLALVAWRISSSGNPEEGAKPWAGLVRDCASCGHQGVPSPLKEASTPLQLWGPPLDDSPAQRRLLVLAWLVVFAGSPGCLEFADVAQEESTEVRENESRGNGR